MFNNLSGILFFPCKKKEDKENIIQSEVLVTNMAEICEYMIFTTLQFGGLFDLKETAEIS